MIPILFGVLGGVILDPRLIVKSIKIFIRRRKKMNHKKNSMRVKSILLFALIFTNVTALYANGVVTDSVTSLEWQNDFSDNGGDIKRLSWKNAIDYCENLNLDGGGWRLPNIRELTSILDNRCCRSFYSFYYFWSSTNYSNSSGSSWAIFFGDDGAIYGRSKQENYFVRCVRTVEP